VIEADYPDGELLARWRGKADREAFGELFKRHQGLLRRVICVALGSAARRDPSCVDDALQECGIRALSSLAAYRGDCSLPAFLAAVARRAALDELRRMLRSRAKSLRAVGASIVREEESPALALERQAAAEAVLGLLDTVKEPDRSLLYLRDAEGIDLKSLARSFGLREGTVKSKLARARSLIRDKALRAWGDQ
jgi:RNA polymerase sigma-70 factor (ECF subfamily)